MIEYCCIDCAYANPIKAEGDDSPVCIFGYGKPDVCGCCFIRLVDFAKDRGWSHTVVRKMINDLKLSAPVQKEILLAMIEGPKYFNEPPPCLEKQAQGGLKYDDGKLRWDLLPVEPIEDVIRVLMFGANKYGEWNWKGVPDWKRRYYSAAIRHITAWFQGKLKDEETGISHITHAICCLLFISGIEHG